MSSAPHALKVENNRASGCLSCFTGLLLQRAPAFVDSVTQWLDSAVLWLTRWGYREKSRAHAFVFPDRNIVIVFLVAVALWYAAASQNSSLAYLLLFWLCSLILVSIVRARTNVANLRITVRSGTPGFANENPKLTCEVFNPSGQPRFALKLRVAGLAQARETIIARIPPGETVSAEIELDPVRRGIHRFEALEVESRFPFQVLIGRAWVPSPGSFLVYPKLAGSTPLPDSVARLEAVEGEIPSLMGDDFYGLRKYNFGDSQRHVDWKAVARGHAMMTKQFGGSAHGELWLDWRTLEEFGFEARISQLARWSCEAELAGQTFGIRMPRQELPIGRGESHLHDCLRALAVYQVDP